VNALNHIDPIIWRIFWGYKEMADYDAANGAISDAKAATVSDFTKNNLNEAQELKAKATKSLYTSYRWLKTSARLLYKLLNRVEL